MDDSLPYIEAYFEKQLGDTEKRQFEERCINDKDFAGKVAFYITAREALRQKLSEQKKKQWRIDEKRKSSENTNFAKVILFKWIPYAVAACLIIGAIIFFLYRAETPQKLAKSYVAKNYSGLSQTMNGARDSLQRAIAAYNNKDYHKALELFENIYRIHPDNSEALKNGGLVYLITKNYDKALQKFDELSNMKQLYVNPGLFLKAITLLNRNKQGDKEQAKLLLEQVVSKNAYGSSEAKEWLKKW
jgi:tetratricopeptide (TPR) repeat protein